MSADQQPRTDATVHLPKPVPTAARRSILGRLRRLGRNTDTTRMYVVLDLENLLHPFRNDPEALTAAFHSLVAQLKELADTIQIIGCGDHTLVRSLLTEASELGVRLYPGQTGPDRADTELISRLQSDRPDSANTIVIGSGDHAFTKTAKQLRRAGLTVIALARRGTISWQLATAIDFHLPMLADTEPGQEHANGQPTEAEGTLTA